MSSVRVLAGRIPSTFLRIPPASRALYAYSRLQAESVVRTPFSRRFCTKPKLDAEPTQKVIESTQPKQDAGWLVKFKEVMRKYGVAAVVTHYTVSWTLLGLQFYILKQGAQPLVEEMLTTFGFGFPSASTFNMSPSLAADATTFAVALAVHKLSLPLRLPLTFALAPKVARQFPILTRWPRKKGPISPPPQN
eukprot:TRINITY_DN5094_c0_g1::TRINITY_DN5094_c0_g1_i1::g.24759::m.24759 TRINITY_DN5094_c0_g1::TRINITY_DN5094_c0_g1_i1::g.24759  ORF type:complete len:207 (-),score=5.81,sp/Q96KR6/F210B_HUMAN/27.83/1e-06,DUF1279/PF06916.8/6.6e-16 TRINITY_DN5094_c0_g1_i1:855-1430(-)